MNRTQATARVDDLLGSLEQELVNGRCPKCGVTPDDMGDAPDKWREAAGDLPGIPASSPVRGIRFIHTETCALATVNQDIQQLVEAYGFLLQPVIIESRPFGPVRVLRRVEVH